MKRVRVTGGFLLVTLWFAAVNGWELLGVVLGAAAVHEAGHCLALKLLGGHILGLRLGVFGAELETDCSRLSYGRELLSVLAGPMANLLCALWLSGQSGTETVTGAHMALCIFNLLPVRPLDGGRALYLLAAWLAGPVWGERTARWSGAICGAALSAGLAMVMAGTGGSLWLLPPAAGALAAAWREIRPCKTGKPW